MTLARKATRDPNPLVRRAALLLCRELSNAEATRDLDRRALDDPDPLVRCEALRWVGVSETPDLFALAALGEAAHDPDARVRLAAAIGLRSYRFASMNALPGLFALAADPDEEVRFGVVVALNDFPKRAQKRALGPLSHLFFDPDRWVRNSMRSLAFKVGSSDPAIRAGLLEGMNEPDARNAQNACLGLLKDLKPVDRPAVRSALLRMLTDHDTDSALVALRGLVQLDPKGTEAIPIVVERILSRGDVGLVTGLDQYGDAGRDAAIGLFDAASPAVAEGILGELWSYPNLLSAVSCAGLRSNHGSVREKSLSVLYTMASRGHCVGDARAADLLLPGLEEPDPETRRMVQGILKGIAPTPNVVRMILRGLRDDDEIVRASALDAIGQHHVFPQPVVEALQDASRDSGAIGSYALSLLAEAGLDDVTTRKRLVARIAADGQYDRRDLASLVAVAERDGLGIDAIVELLERKTASGLNRDAAAELMCYVKRVPGTRRSPVSVLSYWACDWDPHLRQSAVVALGRLGPDAADAVPVLKARLIDESDHVADAARKALAQVRGYSASPPLHARPCRYSCIW